jgi:hypothetical protein
VAQLFLETSIAILNGYFGLILIKLIRAVIVWFDTSTAFQLPGAGSLSRNPSGARFNKLLASS